MKNTTQKCDLKQILDGRKSNKQKKMKYRIGTDTIKFDHFIPLKEQLIKINVKLDGINEGIWACINPKDRKDYDNGVQDVKYTRIAILQNDSISGMLCGTYIPYKLNAGTRPEFDIMLIDPESDIYYAEVEYAQ